MLYIIIGYKEGEISGGYGKFHVYCAEIVGREREIDMKKICNLFIASFVIIVKGPFSYRR